MSVVARQSFKYTLIGYLGFLLGTLSSIFLFTRNFAFYGQLQYIKNTAEVIVPFIVFGISYSNVKFFYQISKDGKHHNMLSLSLLAIAVNFLIFATGFYVVSLVFPEIRTYKVWMYRYYILPLVLMLSLSAVLNKFTSNYKRIAVSNVFDNLFPKLANISAFVLFYFAGASQMISTGVFLLFFLGSTMGYFSYTHKLEKMKPDFSTGYFKQNKLWKEFLSYSFFGFLGTFGNYISINGTMIGEFLGMDELGMYWTLYAMTSLISIPQLGLFNVSAPIINECLEEKKYEELDRFYKKTSLMLFFLGAVLFSCLAIGFPYLASLMKNGDALKDYQLVVWIWGSAILADLATGFNGNIISLSRYYKFNIIVMLLLAVLTVSLNLYFIKETHLRLVGIAISTAISLTVYNAIKIVFNYIKFQVSPFSIEMIYGSIVCTLAITFAMILPDFHNNYINLFYKPAVVLSVILAGNYFLRILPVEEYLTKGFLKSLIKFK